MSWRPFQLFHWRITEIFIKIHHRAAQQYDKVCHCYKIPSFVVECLLGLRPLTTEILENCLERSLRNNNLATSWIFMTVEYPRMMNFWVILNRYMRLNISSWKLLRISKRQGKVSQIPSSWMWSRLWHQWWWQWCSLF